MWLHRFATFLALSTLVLIIAGGMVTSTGSGLAVPDWPNSYGYFMFSFPLSYMVGGIFYEHGHRLIASTVGFLTIILALWLWRSDPRRWVKRLGLIALVAVVIQGTLGGITVLYLLPAPVSIAHAGIAQIFFCLTVSLALFTSPAWIRGYSKNQTGQAASLSAVDDGVLRRLTVATTLLTYAQVLAGATMRHTGAGLAIPDFPLAFGRLLPPVWSTGIAIHFVHRVGAVAVLLTIVLVLAHVWRRHRDRPELVRPAVLLGLLVIVQITLGAYTIWTARAPIVNTAHVGNGALLLVTTLVLTLRAHRLRFAAEAVVAAVPDGRLGEPRSIEARA